MSLSYNPEFSDVSENSFLGGTITVGTTQVEAKVGASRLVGREELVIYNGSSSIIYYGPTGVTTATGIVIEKKQTVYLNYGDIAVYLIAGSAGNTVRIQEAG